MAGFFTAIAEKLGALTRDIKNELDQYIKTMPRQVGGGPGGGSLSAKGRDVLNEAWNHAVKLGDQFLSTEHL
jgi:ATP-dependent Clp protease ATP-binding subunit ClpA